MVENSGPPGLDPDPASTLRIVLADELRMVRSAVGALLEEFGGVEVVGEAGSCAELLTLVDTELPHIVITEAALPGGDAIETIAQLHRGHPDLHVLVLAASADVDLVRRAMANGACGYIVKTAHAYELGQAVAGIGAGGSYFSPSITQALLGSTAPHHRLTPRQIEILRLLVRGHSSRRIAHELGLSAKTVDVHRSRIMQQLQVHGLAALTQYALRHGLVGA